MVKVKLGEDIVESRIRFKVRFDYKGEHKPSIFLFGGKPIEQAADAIREQQISLLRNIPIQGVFFEDFDISAEPYVIFDEALNEKVAYAPAILTANADCIEDMIKFIMRKEFRKIEVLEPSYMEISNKDLEKILFTMNEVFENQMLLFSRTIKN